MQIDIKKIGYKFGTSGWLTAGLADGTISIREGKTKAGKHGLWMHYGTDQQLLAIFNRYDLLPIDYADCNEYTSVESIDMDGRFTPAVVRALIALADAWAEQANEDRSNDNDLTLTPIRVEVANA